MSKCVPTTKTCHEIKDLIAGDRGSVTYVKTLFFDPVDTHGLYNVPVSSIDYYKDRIKSIGGKYIRVVGSKRNGHVTICFALEITPQEALAVKMQKEQEARFKQAYESKLAEIKISILLANAGATNERGQKIFAKMLLDGSLDPLIPFEGYVFVDDPTDKDEKRIYDIVQKANAKGPQGCVGMVTTQRWEMCELANRMNKSITDEDKRARRRAACLKYGLNFLAKCFEKPAAA